MTAQDQIEAEQRRVANAFNMRVARRRFRKEKHVTAPFRAWARQTYNNFACAGKLARIVRARG